MGVRMLSFMAVLAVSFTGPVRAQENLAGLWKGYWQRDQARLEVEVVFTHATTGYAGRFSAEQLRVVGVPFQRVSIEQGRVAWTLAGDATTSVFQGALAGDVLEGRFHEGEAAGTFRLKRSTAVDAGPAEEDVSFSNGAVKLAGTLVRPAGPGPHPAVVFLHGSGPEGRWASRFLADAFARHGIAGLIYDKRGVGASSGDWREAGFAELVGDARAAVEMLRDQARIDPARIGIHGHSQGGTLAPWVAGEGTPIAFVIGSAAVGVSMADAETFSLRNSIGVYALPAEERVLAERFVSALVATAYQGASRDALEQAWQAASGRRWAFAPPPESDFYWRFSRRISSFDPAMHWRRVAVPVLLVYGEADERVPPRASAVRIAEAYLGARGTRLDTIFFAAADHAFRLRARDAGTFAWPVSAPGYPGVIVRWVRDVTKTDGG